MTAPADVTGDTWIDIAYDILRELNDGHEPYAASVMPMASALEKRFNPRLDKLREALARIAELEEAMEAERRSRIHTEQLNEDLARSVPPQSEFDRLISFVKACRQQRDRWMRASTASTVGAGQVMAELLAEYAVGVAEGGV